MKLRADFSRAEFLLPEEQHWIRSPESGVDRIMLDRIGDEVARATSIVRYAPGSSFARHEHALGEEFLVLDGVFADEAGAYPKGTYVRNPPGSGHRPFSDCGCTILVKLRQFDPDDSEQLVVDTSSEDGWTDTGDGVAILALHQYGTERVQMLRLGDNARFQQTAGTGGLELLVVSGCLERDGQRLLANAWMRLPDGETLAVRADGSTLVWLKSGHLPMEN